MFRGSARIVSGNHRKVGLWFGAVTRTKRQLAADSEARAKSVSQGPIHQLHCHAMRCPLRRHANDSPFDQFQPLPIKESHFDKAIPFLARPETLGFLE